MNKISNNIGVIIGIIGIVLSIYFYNSAKEVKELSYDVSNPSFKIYDGYLSNSFRKISLYLNDSIKIQEDVFLNTFSIWNSGNQEVPTKDIRKKLKVEFQGINEILDIIIIKNIDGVISKLEYSSINKNSLEFNWQYLDPNHGIQIQLIYLGKPIIEPIVECKILGTKISKYEPENNKRSLSDILLFIFSLIISCVAIFITIINIKKKKILPIKNFIEEYNNESNIMGKLELILQKSILFVLILVFLFALLSFAYDMFFNYSVFPF